MNWKTQWLGLLGGVAVAVVAGCRSQGPMVMAVPDVQLTHYAGTPLARVARVAQTPAPEISAGNSLGLEIRGYLIANAAGQVMQPFASGAKIMTARGGDSPLLAVASSLADARIGVGADAAEAATAAAGGKLGPVVALDPRQAVLAPGISAQIRVSPAHAGDRAGDFQDVEVVFSRSEQAGIRVALTRESLYTPPADENEAPRLPQPRRETAVTSVDYAEGQDLIVAVLVPASITPKEKQSILFLAHITPGSEDPAHVAAVEAARNELAAGAERTQSASYEELVLRSALRVAESDEARRAALVYLATQGQAPIFLDAAMVADDGVLRQFAEEIGKTSAEKAPLGWRLDRVAFETMGKLLMEKRLSPELRAVMSKHAGEAGCSPASLEQLVGRTVSRKDLENRLIAENYIFLEEISPAARVRAYDWLNAMGKAPPGYDPLGPVDQRRKALEAAIEQMTQGSMAGEGK